MRFRVLRGRVEVMARGPVSETTVVWSQLTGHITLDPDELDAAQAELALDMRVYDAGDPLKNWSLKSALDPEHHPRATFTLMRLEHVVETMGGRYEGIAVGAVGWRGRQVDVRARGKASVDRREVSGSASFELDLTRLGVAPSFFLATQPEDVVRVLVSLFAAPG